jgi:hypothetical protein
MRFKLFGTLTAAVLLVLLPSQALAHDIPSVATQGAGMLTFTASADLASPPDGHNWAGTSLRITGSDHFVQITAAGGQGGTVVGIDYYLGVAKDSSAVGTPKEEEDYDAGIVAGLWRVDGDFDYWVSATLGQHSASARADLRWPSASINLGAIHGHSFTVVE